MPVQVAPPVPLRWWLTVPTFDVVTDLMVPPPCSAMGGFASGACDLSARSNGSSR